jgi:hypothetical protein
MLSQDPDAHDRRIFATIATISTEHMQPKTPGQPKGTAHLLQARYESDQPATIQQPLRLYLEPFLSFDVEMFIAAHGAAGSRAMQIGILVLPGQEMNPGINGRKILTSSVPLLEALEANQLERCG